MVKKCWHKWNTFEEYLGDGKYRKAKGCKCVKCGMVRDEGHYYGGKCACRECGKTREVTETKEKCFNPYVGSGWSRTFYGIHSESYYYKGSNYTCERCGAVNIVLKTRDERGAEINELIEKQMRREKACPEHIWVKGHSPCYSKCKRCGASKEHHDFPDVDAHENYYTTVECRRPGCGATITL